VRKSTEPGARRGCESEGEINRNNCGHTVPTPAESTHNNDMSKTKNVTVKVRMTAEEKQKLKLFAREHGMTLSVVVREGVWMVMEDCQ